MNKRHLTTILILLGTLNLSMHSDPIYSILSDEDYRVLNEENENGPALSSSLDANLYWESYNQWICFSAEDVDVRLSEHQLEHPVQVPTLSTWLDDHLYEFEISSNLIRGDMGSDIINQWDALIDDEMAFCIKAAFLQPLDSQSSLWILKSLKTRKGYWHQSII